MFSDCSRCAPPGTVSALHGACLRILLLNQTFYPDVMATGQYLAEVAVALAERGHQVIVVTSQRAYDNPDLRFPKHEIWRGITIHRVGSTRFGKGAKWRRAADFASFIVSCCIRLVTLPRPDVVLALTSPPLISFIGAWLAKLHGSRFVYWVMDFNPDEAIAAGWLRADSLTGRLLDQMSRFSLRRADRIIALDRFMRDRIVAKGISPDKIAVLPPWSHDDEVRFDAAGRERFRQQHGLADKFVVMYSGNHSPVHPLDTLLDAAQRLEAHRDIVFAFIGGGSEFKRIQALLPHTPNLFCLPYQPLTELSTSLSSADLHVVVMGNAFVGLVHPCKIYNILAVGAPVLYIGPSPSHLTEIQVADQPHLSVRHGEGESLAPQILALKNQLAATRGQIPQVILGSPSSTPRSRPVVLQQFSKQNLLPQFLDLVENLAGNVCTQKQN